MPHRRAAASCATTACGSRRSPIRKRRCPDATRLLADQSVNDFERFAVGQAKQYVPVTGAGHFVTDGILLCEAQTRYPLSGIPAAHHWVRYHVEKGGYDVSFITGPSSAFRSGGGAPGPAAPSSGPPSSPACWTCCGGTGGANSPSPPRW
ncbi:hypothetical protein ACWCYL_27085 [Streptomyces sp. 900105755]